MKDLEQITRDDIIEAGIVLFGKYGFQNVSLDRLADYLGHSKSIIYKYFPSKKSVLHAAVRMIKSKMKIEIPSLDKIQARLAVESPKQILLSYCYSPDEESFRYFTYYRLLYREVNNFKRLRVIAYRIWQNNYAALCGILEHMAHLGAIPRQPDRALAEIWVRVVFGFTLWKTFDQYLYGEEYREITELFISLVTSGNNRVDSGAIVTHETKRMAAGKPVDFRQNIAEAAFQLFSDYGYEKTTVKMLATRLNCHVSRIYNYYKGKQDILLGVFEHIKAARLDDLDNNSFTQYKTTGMAEDLVAVLLNSYVCQDENQLRQYRIWINTVYENRDIRYYCLGCLIEKRVAFKMAVHELVVNREISNDESMHLATIYTFCQSSINIENALFHRDISMSETFRLNLARIIASIVLYGVLTKDEWQEERISR